MMNIVGKKVALNITTLGSTHVVSGILFISYNAILARSLGSLDYGKYAFCLALVSVFSIIVEFGVGTLIVRDVSRQADIVNKYLWNALVLKCILALSVLFALYIVFSFLYIDFDSLYLVFLLFFAVSIDGFSNVFIAIFKAHELMIYSGLYQVFKSMLILFASLKMLLYGGNLIELGVLYLIASLISFILISLLYSKRLHKPHFECEIEYVHKMAMSSMPFFFSSVLAVLYERSDTILIRMLQGPTEVGLYNAAYKFVDLLTFVPGIFIAATFPAMSKAHFINSIDTLRLIHKKLLQISVILVLPVAVVVTFYASDILMFTFGPEFKSANSTFIVLAWCLVLVFINAPTGAVLNASGNHNKAVVSLIIVLIVNITLNYFLIEAYGFFGASIALFISHTLSVILMQYLVGQYCYSVRFFTTIVKPSVSALIMGILMYFADSLGYTTKIMNLIISFLAYFLLLLLLRVFSKEDIMLIKILLQPNEKIDEQHA